MMKGHRGGRGHLGEGVQGVHQLQLCVPAQGDHLVHLLQAQADAVEARHELVQPPLAHILMLSSHLRHIAVHFLIMLAVPMMLMQGHGIAGSVIAALQMMFA